MIGGAVMGIGMTMLEETVFDPETSRVTNAIFGDYLIPAHADVPDVDVVSVGAPDPVRPLGIKGVGEIGIVGVFRRHCQRRVPRDRPTHQIVADHR